jgi:transposase
MKHFIGMDIHRKFSQVCVMDEEGRTVSQRRLRHDHPQRLVQYFEGFSGQAQVAMEATVGWMWLADTLESVGLEVKLAHPAGVRLIAENRLKSDKVDARSLAQLLRTGFLPEAYLAPREVRDRRVLLRYRQGLVKTRTMVKCRIHALLIKWNIELDLSDSFGRQGRQLLRTMELAEPDRTCLQGWLDLLDFLDVQVGAVERRLVKTLPDEPRAVWLTTIPGVGKLTAYLILAEVGHIERFPSAKKFVSYCGLCPSNRGTAGRTWHGSIGPAGRKALKSALVESAHVAARRDPYLRRLYHGQRSTKGAGKAIVIVARKMARIIYQVLKEGRPYRVKVASTPVGPTHPVASA